MARQYILGLFSLTLGIQLQAQDNQLKIPDTLVGPVFNLEMINGQTQFWPGVNTNTSGFNGSFLGPTLIFNAGDEVDISVKNSLGESTTVHWHGMHVSPANDGGPHTVIEDDSTWNPKFEVIEKATTFWYHPHLHEQTMEQVLQGLAGLIIVRDEEEKALDLPRTYGQNDIPLVIQDRSFQNNQFIMRPMGDSVIVNGTIRPYVDLPAGIVRLRLLNGSAERTYNIGINDTITFHMIGSDGGLLNAPVALKRLRLAPGERAEILVDLSQYEAGRFNLMSYASELPNTIFGSNRPAPGGGTALDGIDFPIIQLRVGEPAGGPSAIPNELVVVDRIHEENANRTRT